jgi:xanthine/uracil permease
MWKCLECETMNHDDQTACVVCGEVKPAERDLDADNMSGFAAGQGTGPQSTAQIVSESKPNGKKAFFLAVLVFIPIVWLQTSTAGSLLSTPVFYAIACGIVFGLTKLKWDNYSEKTQKMLPVLKSLLFLFASTAIFVAAQLMCIFLFW